MNEVVSNSTSKLTLEDARAMATYIKSLPAEDVAGRRSRPSQPVTAEQAALGQAIYEDRCEKCHGASGRGGMFSGPPLAGSADRAIGRSRFAHQCRFVWCDTGRKA